MGNGNTKGADSLEAAINDYATKYILRASFQDMVQMSNQNFCDELVVLTTDLIDSKFSSKEIDHIANLEKYKPEKPTRKKVRYIAKKTMKSLMNQETKLGYCRGIARYYVKVLNLFSAIVMTLNPQFEFQDSSGQKKTVKLKDRTAVRDERRLSVSFSSDNICGRRFEALMRNATNDPAQNKDAAGNVRIENSVCKMNKERTHLGQEVGCPN